MADLAADQVVRRGPVLWRRVGDEVLIRRRGIEQLTVLAAGGAALWDAMAEPASVAELAARLAVDHNADPSEVATDVAATLADLVAAGVVVS